MVVVRVEDPNAKLNKFVLIGWVISQLYCVSNDSVVRVSQNTRKDYSIPTSSPSQSS